MPPWFGLSGPPADLSRLESTPSLTPPAPPNGSDRLRRAQAGLEPSRSLANGKPPPARSQAASLEEQLAAIPAEPMQAGHMDSRKLPSEDNISLHTHAHADAADKQPVRPRINHAGPSAARLPHAQPSYQPAANERGPPGSNVPSASGASHPDVQPPARPANQRNAQRAELVEDFELEDELRAMTRGILGQGEGPQRAKFSLPKPPVIIRKAIQLGSPHGQGPAPAGVKRRADAAAGKAPPQVCSCPCCLPSLCLDCGIGPQTPAERLISRAAAGP